jgi:hypothetical protein
VSSDCAPCASISRVSSHRELQGAGRDREGGVWQAHEPNICNQHRMPLIARNVCRSFKGYQTRPWRPSERSWRPASPPRWKSE